MRVVNVSYYALVSASRLESDGAFEQFNRSEAYKKQETDLVILVTPRLIRPMVPGDKIATPFDNRRPASDAEFFLGGQQEVQVSHPKFVGGQIIDYTPEPSAGGWAPAKSGPEPLK